MYSIQYVLKKYSSKLDRLDIELIISAAIKKPREFILTHPEYNVSKRHASKINFLLKRRVKGEPMAYILGKKEFFGLDFKVNKNVLVPRPETELLVEEVIKLNPNNKMIVDIGTGSGNVIVSLAKNIKNENIFIATDISLKALGVAKQNAKKHRIKKIKFLQGDLLKPILENNKLKGRNCIILANLPYLDLDWKNLLKSSETKGLKFEPAIALYAGKDGLDTYRKFANQLKFLKRKTKNRVTILCEIGHLQINGIRKIFYFAKKLDFLRDLARKWRVCKIEL